MIAIMQLNTWATMCGHFFSCREDKPAVNNGYNCNHPEQWEEYKGVGCCFAHSCPLAYSADGVMCQRFGVECEDCGNEYCECEEDMMVCEISDGQFDERYMWCEASLGGGWDGRTDAH